MERFIDFQVERDERERELCNRKEIAERLSKQNKKETERNY